MHINEEVFTAEEIQFLRLATGAVHFLAQQEMENEDYTETAVMLNENAPVVMRKLDRLLNSETIPDSEDALDDTQNVVKKGEFCFGVMDLIDPPF